MKFLMLSFSLVLMVSVSQVKAGRCARSIQQCNVYNPSTGTWNYESYDNCLYICCGGKLTERDVNMACCGNEVAGVIYDPSSQICCGWGYPGDWAVYNKTEGAQCCGTKVYYNTPSDRKSCCYSQTGKPQVFDSLTEMCCDGNVAFAGDTAYTSCCGPVSYDRRVASCPCQNEVIVLIPDVWASCCMWGGVMTPYDLRTQACCEKDVYNTATHMCCGGVVGDLISSVCCGDVIVPANVSFAAEAACCVSASGQYSVYDPNTQRCCGGVVQPAIPGVVEICCGTVIYDVAVSGDKCCVDQPYFSDKNVCCRGVVSPGDACCYDQGYFSPASVCCGDVVYNSSVSGDACCNNQPFFNNGFVCCNGFVTPGDSCCYDVGYFHETQVCCAGVVSTHNYVWPSCCVDVPFDAYNQTCCGSTVHPNPVIQSPNGPAISHHTRCCGDFANPSSLLPYDYDTQICCDGVIIDLVGIPADYAECCGASVIDTNNFQCCGGIPMEISQANACCADVIIDATVSICCDETEAPLQGNYTKCCGSVSYDANLFTCCNGVVTPLNNIPIDVAVCCGSNVMNSVTSVCCAGVVNNVISNVTSADTVCCGSTIMNLNTEICCEGVPRSLDGVPRDEAICCGDGCIDGSLYFCCDGKQYSKGVDHGPVTGLTCNQLFP